MAINALRPVIAIVGVGHGSGTGASTARQFAKAGWSVALIARERGTSSVQELSDDLNKAGGNTTPILLPDYSPQSYKTAFETIKARYPSDEYALRAAVFNAGSAVWKPFLEITLEELQQTLLTNVEAAWSFARESILAFKQNEITEREGKRGTLIFTGATASVRGNVLTSAFSTSKAGLRNLSQSLAKEFGKERIHVAHAIIDGGIKTGQRLATLSAEEQANLVALEPEQIAEAYLALVNQHHSASTWELDLRPLQEKW